MCYNIVSIALKINEFGWSFPFDKIESGLAAKEDFELWLQNKCLNSSYKFDEMADKLLPVGNDLDGRATEICQKIDKSATYYAFMSADEILLLRKISSKVTVYSYDEKAENVLGNTCYRPVVPTIAYMSENFFELSKLYLQLQKIVWSYKKIDKSINKYILGDFSYNKANKQYLLGNFKKCIKIIKKCKSDNKYLKYSLLFKANYCLGRKDKAVSALKMVFDSTTLKPVSIRSLLYDFHLDFETMDDAVYEEVCSRYTTAEILEMVEEIERERNLIANAAVTSKEIQIYYETKLKKEKDGASQRMQEKHKKLEKIVQKTQLTVEIVENPNQEFWIWEKKITNKQNGRIYPLSVSNVGSGISVAVYQSTNNQSPKQIAQLQLPDYAKLVDYYANGRPINLDYVYLDNFAWLGDKKPYEVEGQPYRNYNAFSARCSIFNNWGGEDYLHMMQMQIKSGDVDFSYAGFYNIKLDICDLMIENGNLEFNSARFYNADISLGSIACGGTQFFKPEVSFRYITADTLHVETMLMSQKLSVDFLCASTQNSTILLDPLPSTFNEINFVKAQINKITITNAEIASLDVREAKIKELEFCRCKFYGLCEIEGDIKDICINSCLNSAVFKLLLPRTDKLSFSGTINNGRICFADFKSSVKAIQKHIDHSSCDYQQWLMLKENFRQSGEYENEDICHLRFQREKTKKERNIIKKAGRYFLDCISGYGTNPLRMLGVILATIVLFGTLYYFVPIFDYHGVTSWLEHIYASGITFFAVGYGDLFPLNVITKMVSLIEAFMGVSATSYFLVLLSRKVIR